MSTADIAAALAVCAEVMGRELSEPALEMMARDLGRYRQSYVFAALDRCRREVKGRLTLADVIERLDDGRPGPEEAWAAVPKDEGETVVWTYEMMLAHAACLGLIAAGDLVAARMAFIESYRKLLVEARSSYTPVQWRVSLGHDPAGREGPVVEAVEKGRLPAAQAVRALPASDAVQALAAGRALEVQS